MHATKPEHRLLLIVILLVAFGVLVRIGVFEASVAWIPAFDDECKIALQAKQIARGDRPLLILASPYIFPLDAYLMAPFIHWLPRNALGARIMACGFGIVSILLALSALRRWLPAKDHWCGAALIVFPSAYLLVLQSGCALPGYPTLILLSVLILWLTQVHRTARRYGIPALLAGLAGGLAASDTLLAVSVVAVAGLMIAFGRGWKSAIISTTLFALGACIGFLPHLAAAYQSHDAFQAVSQTVTLKQAAKKLWDPALSRVLPAALGWRPPLYPDTRDRVAWLTGGDLFLGIAWLLFLLVLTVVSVRDCASRWKRDHWPSIDLGTAAVGISWLGLGLFLVSYRSHLHTYRYLLSLLLCFPLLIAYAYSKLHGKGRYAMATLAVVLAAGNITSSAGLIRAWASPGFANEMLLYDLKPVISYLTGRGIDRCYATYADAYRMTFETDEKMLCSQPFNERFPGWPVPFKAAVDASTNVAYVLSNTYRFTPIQFQRDMVAMGVKARIERHGNYYVYTDFAPGDPASEAPPQTESQVGPPLVGAPFIRPPTSGGPTANVTHLYRFLRGQHSSGDIELPRERLAVEVSDNPVTAARLVDGNPSTRWRTRTPQHEGMWLEIQLPGTAVVSRVVLYYNQCRLDRAQALRVMARTGNEWNIVADRVASALDKFDFAQGHPIYGNEMQTLHLPAVATDRLRIEILEPEPGRAWSIGEVRVFAKR